jgi:transcriptional regulator with XRE-family HTH domain
MLQQIRHTGATWHTMPLVGRGIALPALRRIRHEKLMKQTDLAKASGVNRSTIAMIEAQNKPADITTLGKLAAALGVEPSELMAE